MLSGIPSRYGTSGYEFKSLVDFSHLFVVKMCSDDVCACCSSLC